MSASGLGLGTALAAKLAFDPSTAFAVSSVFGTQVQYVSEAEGNDSNDGLTPASAKYSIEAAIAATPNGAAIYIAPGSYRPTGTLRLNGHALVNPGGSQGGTGVNAKVTIQHKFNGDLIDFTNPGTNYLSGGTLHGLTLYQNAHTPAYTGAAIAARSATGPRTGGIYIQHVTVTGDQGFERDLDLDGGNDSTAGGPGIRQCFVYGCQFFGARTAGETVRLTRAIHVYFANCNIIAAPESTVGQGLKVVDAQSEDVHWTGGYILGSVSCAAAGYVGLQGTGQITNDLVWETGAANNLWSGLVRGSVVNNGASSNGRGVATSMSSVRMAGSIELPNGLGGDRSSRRLRINGGQPGDAGLLEMNNRMSVSDNHPFGSFPDPGAGSGYFDAGIVLKSPNGHFWRLRVSDTGAVTTTDLGTSLPS